MLNLFLLTVESIDPATDQAIAVLMEFLNNMPPEAYDQIIKTIKTIGAILVLINAILAIVVGFVNRAKASWEKTAKALSLERDNEQKDFSDILKIVNTKFDQVLKVVEANERTTTESANRENVRDRLLAIALKQGNFDQDQLLEIGKALEVAKDLPNQVKELFMNNAEYKVEVKPDELLPMEDL